MNIKELLQNKTVLYSVIGGVAAIFLIIIIVVIMAGSGSKTGEVLDKIDKEEEQELVEDLVQIITVYACKLQGRKKKNTSKLLKEINKVLK